MQQSQPSITTSNLGHQQIKLVHPYWSDLAPFVDVEIAPIISACWTLGINTQQCCWKYTERQESWIQFASVRDAVKFLSFTVEVARDMRVITDPTSPVLRPEVWFPHFEIPTILKALTRRAQVPM
jgi:hypothetical protein